MTADGWAAFGLAILSVLGSWISTKVKIARLEERVATFETKQQEHGNSFTEFREAITELTRVVDRLATIEEIRSRREAAHGGL